jgi:hypothetical protein
MVLVVGVDHAPTTALATEACTLSQVGSASGRVLEAPPRVSDHAAHDHRC